MLIIITIITVVARYPCQSICLSIYLSIYLSVSLSNYAKRTALIVI